MFRETAAMGRLSGGILCRLGGFTIWTDTCSSSMNALVREALVLANLWNEDYRAVFAWVNTTRFCPLHLPFSNILK